jgi:hypothetical protein
MTDKQIEEVIRGNDGRAHVVNSLEIAALLESSGYSDRTAQKSGFENVFAHADWVLRRIASEGGAGAGIRREVSSREREWAVGLQKISLSLAYALPWMALLALEYIWPNALEVAPELGGALSLSLILSLMLTGGFIQTITRIGTYYYGMEQPVLARRACMRLLNLGLTFTLAMALVGILLGFYFHLFPVGYLLMAVVDYIGLSLLWMLCAALSVQRRGWCIPAVFLAAGISAGLAKFVGHAGSALTLLLCPLLGVMFAIGSVWRGFRELEKGAPAGDIARPRVDVLAISLVPFFAYGMLYFSFLFADRVAAGSTIPWASGLSFGIDPAYKEGMDLVLLAFLLTAAVVEYLGDCFLRYWHRLALELPQTAGEKLKRELQQRHRLMLLAIASLFLAIAAGAGYGFWQLDGGALSLKLLQTAVLGGIGYLLLSLALFESVILASVNTIVPSLVAISIGLAVNWIMGYSSSHLWGVQYAAAGLLAGSAAVLWKQNGAVRKVLRAPDYHYSVS